MIYHVRPRVSTTLDSRLWKQALRDKLGHDVTITFTTERAEVPVGIFEIPDGTEVTTMDVVKAGHSLNLTILEE